MIMEDLTPSKILTQEAFRNAIVTNSALGGSTNAPVHITAIARHIGLELPIEDWQTYGYEIPLLLNCQPAGEYLGEGFYRAGGVPAIMAELLKAGKLNGDCLTVTGKTMGENLADRKIQDERVIKSYDQPLKERAGFIVLSGNLFDSGLLKTSVIGEAFRRKYLVRIDLNKGTVNMLVSDDELAQRREAWQPPELNHQTPWQEIYRDTVGQLATGACLELAVKYQGVRKNIPRHSH
jgi:dihydroxy-acid dehydratase